jgi:PAS domain S-box-containing protein
MQRERYAILIPVRRIRKGDTPVERMKEEALDDPHSAGAPSAPQAIVPERLLAALRASGTGVWHWDIRSDRVEWDDTLCRIYGVTREQAARSAAEFLAFVHQDDRPAIADTIAAVMKGGAEAEYEFRTILPDGRVRWIFDRCTVARSVGGEPVYMAGACFDITERKKVEEALGESEARLELATAAGEIGIWDWNLLTSEMIYSDRAKALFGLRPEDAMSFERTRDATHPDDLPRTLAMAKRALDPSIRERQPYEYRIIRADGTTRWMLAHGQALFGAVDGVTKAIRYIGTIQDITARKEMEAALAESEGRLRLAIDAGRMAVWELDVARNRLIGSVELNRLLGFPDDAEPSVEEIRSRYFPGERERVQRAGQEAFERGDQHMEVEYQYLMPDSSVRWLMLRAEFVLTPLGKPERVVGVLLDITETKRAAERQQLLTRELDHRVKNTLATVQSLVSQTLRGAKDVSRVRQDIGARIASLARAHDLLTEERWEGAGVAAVVDRALSPFEPYRNRIAASGPNARLEPKAAVNLALILHELMTNSLKHGSLSANGRVEVKWSVYPEAGSERLGLRWAELDGPEVGPPNEAGFGMLLVKGLGSEFGREAKVEFDPAGVICVFDFALPHRDTPPTKDDAAIPTPV